MSRKIISVKVHGMVEWKRGERIIECPFCGFTYRTSDWKVKGGFYGEESCSHLLPGRGGYIQKSAHFTLTPREIAEIRHRVERYIEHWKSS